MNDYYSIRIDLLPCSEDATDYLAALLGDAGCESFVPDESGLTAYVKSEEYDTQAVAYALAELPFDCDAKCTVELIPGKDWNEEWEKNYFQPIVVGNDGGQGVVIHSTFHTDVPEALYDIVIDPKMAFGTGHHATTAQIIAQLLEMPMRGRTVIDMGTGTGILAFLAEKRGAERVTGIEIDAFAFENAKENAALNSCEKTILVNGCADNLQGIEPADIFIANINRNIIISDLHAYVEALKPGGAMLLSGFYEHDVPKVCEAAEKYGMKFEKATSIRSDQQMEQRKFISARPQASDYNEAEEEECKQGTYGAVNAAKPESAWACLVMKKINKD